MCCIVGESVTSDVCPLGSNKKRTTIIISVTLLGTVFLFSLMVCGYCSYNRNQVAKSSSTTEVCTTNGVDQDQPLTPQQEHAQIEVVENISPIMGPPEFKNSDDILPSAPIAIAQHMLPPPPSRPTS